MWITGIAYSSPHVIVEALQLSCQVHLYRHHRVPSDKKKAELVEEKNKEAITDLKAFLPGKPKKPKVLLIDGLTSYFRIRKAFKLERNRKDLCGIIIFDNPSNLFDYAILILDAVRVKEGMWWKKKDFVQGLSKELKSDSMPIVDPLLIKPIKRKKISSWHNENNGRNVGEVKSTNKARGFISHFIQAVKVHIEDGEDKKLLKSVLGHFLGVVPKSGYKDAVSKLVEEHGVPKKVISSLEKYAGTRNGTHLISVFYLSQKGRSFASMQREFKSLQMDDWLVLQEYIPSTSKYKFFSAPKTL